VAGDQVSADPGVAVNANAENATADAVAILPIVFIPFSNKVEPPWAPAVIEFGLSPIRLPALVVSVVHLTIKSLLCCKQSSPAHDRPAGCVSVCFRNAVC
jgi:hypothetical protein